MARKVPTWRHLVDGLASLHPGEECPGVDCRICKALVQVTHVFHDRDHPKAEPQPDAPVNARPNCPHIRTRYQADEDKLFCSDCGKELA